MKREEVWTASGGHEYSGKPRPVVIVQEDGFAITGSITVCPLTTNPSDAPIFRLPVAPSPMNGLRESSRLMVDKIATLPRTKLGIRIGRLSDDEMVRLNLALAVFRGNARRKRNTGQD